jgi:hypothetical protein
MTDERAIQLANMLGEYLAECRGEGMAAAEVANMTIREVVADINESTAFGSPLSRDARVLLNDFAPFVPGEDLER